MFEAICFVPAFWENIKTDLSPYTELESIIFKLFSQNWHKFVSNFVNLEERLRECKKIVSYSTTHIYDSSNTTDSNHM